MSNFSPAAHLSTIDGLRSIVGMWAVAAILPLPVLVAIDPTRSADVSCLYLGIINAWLVTEFYRTCGMPDSATSWREMMLVITTAISVNVAIFVVFGLAAGVQTHFPFILMSVLSAVPAIGMMPWILRRVSQQPYFAIVIGGFLVFACKLAGCVVACFFYGQDYIEQGYVAADWRTAKLMITLFWVFSTLLSAGMLLVEYTRCANKIHDDLASPPSA